MVTELLLILFFYDSKMIALNIEDKTFTSNIPDPD